MWICLSTEPPMTTPPNIEGDCPAEIDGAVTTWEKFGSYCYWTSGTRTANYEDAEVDVLDKEK